MTPPDPFEMVMPFLPVASKGGPHDDDAYCAGWEAGLIDALLADPLAFGCQHRVIHVENRGQADLIAMRHGWRAEFFAQDVDGWVGVEFVRLDKRLDKTP